MSRSTRNSPKRRSGAKRAQPVEAAARRFQAEKSGGPPLLRQSPPTLGGWLKSAEKQYQAHNLALGQVAATPHDEALYLLLRVLDLPLESGPEVLKRRITSAEAEVLRAALQRRVIERVPAAYITREAWLGGRRFYIDERVIIPRSYFVELIPEQLESWLPAGVPIKHVVDVCTGSGCLAILLAEQFPQAKVDAIDLSADALAVAEINLKEHRLGKRVTLHQSDVFGKVPPVKYDVIVSNPPYEPSALVDGLPPEFQSEPRLALDGGLDGMDIIRRLVKQARGRLQPHGILAIEVGALHAEVDREFHKSQPHWLHTADGSDCVVLFQAARLG